MGALIGGVAIGASARMRVMGPAFLGGALGIVALTLLSLTQTGTGSSGLHESGAAAGVAIIAVIAGIVTMLGAGIGWTIWGKKNAG